MTEIGFYHLLTTPLEKALPRLLEKVVEGGRRALVMAGSAERVAWLDATLWTYDPASFLPHGTARDGRPERQPIYLTMTAENPNAADVLVLIDGVETAPVSSFARCVDMFDGGDPAAVEAARQRWKARKAEGHAVTYWQQADGGRWEKKA
ncbi:MAG: DNA polymerase III subunit chi [Alphaproteobacteria bacterium]|nr:DNA polymerase III subunit chi [Alphaproteobacteria bacterium]